MELFNMYQRSLLLKGNHMNFLEKSGGYPYFVFEMYIGFRFLPLLRDENIQMWLLPRRADTPPLSGRLASPPAQPCPLY